jgi:hypothetical protein
MIAMQFSLNVNQRDLQFSAMDFGFYRRLQ